jgi:anti-sigma regulatory factor (Ser/Thr protein kinase)
MATIAAPVREPADPPQPVLAGWPLRAVLDLGALPTAPGCARAWTAAILREWRLSGLADTAELIVSELVTNSVHACRRLALSAIRLILVSDQRRLAILVRDAASVTPAPRHPGADDESGRGLLLVESMSDQFGWYPCGDGGSGKVVWSAISALLSGVEGARSPAADGTKAGITRKPGAHEPAIFRNNVWEYRYV